MPSTFSILRNEINQISYKLKCDNKESIMVHSHVSGAKKGEINVDENLSITETLKLRDKEKINQKYYEYADPSIATARKRYSNWKS
jgi:hypothetical protein